MCDIFLLCTQTIAIIQFFRILTYRLYIFSFQHNCNLCIYSICQHKQTIGLVTKATVGNGCTGLTENDRCLFGFLPTERIPTTYIATGHSIVDDIKNTWDTIASNITFAILHTDMTCIFYRFPYWNDAGSSAPRSRTTTIDKYQPSFPEKSFLSTRKGNQLLLV